MTRFTSILSTLALVPTTLALATPALASTVQDVMAKFGQSAAGNERFDLNCDGVIGIPDLVIADAVVRTHSSPGFNHETAVRNNFGATLAELGSDFPHEADLNGDCAVGVPDLEDSEATLSALGQSQAQDLLQLLKDDWGTRGDSPVDLNCDGVVGVPDLELVYHMIGAQHAPHFDTVVAIGRAYGTSAGNEKYHPAADTNGDCTIGVPDLINAYNDLAVDQ